MLENIPQSHKTTTLEKRGSIIPKEEAPRLVEVE